MRMKLLAALLAAFLAPAALAEPITINTATGPVTLTAGPKRIAVFDIAAIDTLTTLGVRVDGTPNKLYLASLAPVRAAAAPVGTLFEPNFEALAIMAPDLIVVGGRSSPQARALSRIAPVIDMTVSGATLMAQARSNIAAFGALFGRQREAEALNARLDDAIARARKAIEGKGDALMVLTNGSRISAFGPGSRFGWLHETLGLPTAAKALKAGTHGQAISFEFIASTDPDWILVVDRGAAIGQDGQAARATLDNPIVARTRAARAGRIVYLDSAALYISGGGAGAMLRTLEEIAAVFSGEKR